MADVLMGFISKINRDPRLFKSHVNVLLALIAIGKVLGHPFRISRKEVMSQSLVRSKVTYHRCIKDLQALQYLEYHPSYHPGIETTVTILAGNDPLVT